MGLSCDVVRSKVCSKCLEEKSVSEFYASKGSKDGLHVHCKECKKAARKVWYSSNKERAREYNVEWREANKEKSKQLARSWYERNRERKIAYNRAWSDAHPECGKAAAAVWRAVNKERLSVIGKEWKKANPDAVKAYWHTRRARIMGSGGVLSRNIRDKLYALQKGKCACCKKPLGDDYHLDHIMPLALGGSNTDDNVQLLRQRCNSQKAAKNPIDFMREKGFLL